MFTIYRLSRHSRRLEAQSPDWWRQLDDGLMPVQHLTGTISSVHMGSMNDWPEFTVRDASGAEFTWSRYANEPEFDAFYVVGWPFELYYVIEPRPPDDVIGDIPIPLEIRVAENT